MYIIFVRYSLFQNKFLETLKSNKNKKSQEEEVAKDQNNELPEEELIVERVYIEDEKKKKDGKSLIYHFSKFPHFPKGRKDENQKIHDF